MRLTARWRAALADRRFRAFTGNSAWSIGAAVAAAVAALVETVILAHALSPQRFGVYVLVLAYPEAVQQVLDFRVRDAMTKYLGEFAERGDGPRAVAIVKLLWLADVVVGVVVFAIVAATAFLVARHLLDDPALAWLLVVYGAGVLVGSLDTASGAVMRVLDRYALAFGTGATAEAQRVALVAGVIAAGGGLHALVLARAAAHAVATVVQGAGALIALKPLAWPHRRTRMSALGGRGREITQFLVSTNLLGALRAASTKLDVLLIGALATPAAVALYRVALQFAKVPLLVSDALGTVAYPMFARDVAGGRLADARALARRLSIALAVVAVPATAAAAAVSQPLIELVAGAHFAGAATPFRILLLGIVPAVVFFWTPLLLLALGRAGLLLRLGAISLVAQFVLIVALVPKWGATGGAWGMAVAFASAIALYLVALRRGGERVSASPASAE